jgi:phospholipase/carboxylesterase
MAPKPPRVLHEGVTAAPERLVVFLHGVGASADDLLPIASALAPSLPGAEILLPDGFHAFDGGGGGRQWFSLRGVNDANRPARVRAAAIEVDAYLEQELSRRHLARDRLVVIGFSQGAMLGEWLAVHRPLRAVVAFSGRFADDEPVVRTTTPVLIVHGARDPLIPVAEAHAAAAALEARGAAVTVHIHPALGHGIDPKAVEEARAFLEAHAK